MIETETDAIDDFNINWEDLADFLDTPDDNDGTNSAGLHWKHIPNSSIILLILLFPFTPKEPAHPIVPWSQLHSHKKRNVIGATYLE